MKALFSRCRVAWNVWFGDAIPAHNVPEQPVDMCFWILYGDHYSQWTRLTKIILVVILVSWWFWPRTPLVECTPDHHRRTACGDFLVDHDGELLFCAPNGNEYRNPRIVTYSNVLDTIEAQVCGGKTTLAISKYVRLCTHRNLCFDLDSHTSKCIQTFFLFNGTVSPVPPNCFAHSWNVENQDFSATPS